MTCVFIRTESKAKIDCAKHKNVIQRNWDIRKDDITNSKVCGGNMKSICKFMRNKRKKDKKDQDRSISQCRKYMSHEYHLKK